MGTVTRREGRAAVLALVAATAAALAYAYTFTFSQFVPYDDEGYFTVTVQHLLAGHRLYDDVPVPYGPFFYLSRWLIHGTLHVPLVTDAVRLITIGHWLLCAALLAAVTYRLSHRQDGRLVLATMTLVAMALHLSTAQRPESQATPKSWQRCSSWPRVCSARSSRRAREVSCAGFSAQ